VRLCSVVGAIRIAFVLYLLRAHSFYCGCCSSIPNQLSCVFLRIMCECLDSKHLDEFILQFCTTGSMYSWAYHHGCFRCPCWDEALWRSFVIIVVGLSLRGYHRCLDLPPPKKAFKARREGGTALRVLARVGVRHQWHQWRQWHQ